MAAAGTMATWEKLRNIQAELNTEFFERSDVIEALVHALVTGQHMFMLGAPGTGKSMLARAVCNRVENARYWEILLDRQTPLESIAGPVDIKEFEASGDWHRRIDGYAPTAHIAFWDEVGKAGPATTNPILTLLNERKFHNNSKPHDCPLIFSVGASNEELEMPEQAALWDRWLLRVIVEHIQEPGNFAALLSSATSAPSTGAQPTTVTLTEVEQAWKVDVPAVTLPPGVIDSILQLRSDLRAEQIAPSDRRWKQSVSLVQASAYLAGRTSADDDDLAILRHALWDVVEQLPTVEKKVLALTSPLTRSALEFAAQLDEIEAGIDARKGQSVESRAAYGGEAKSKVDTIAKKLNDLTEKANRQGRNTAKLQQVQGRLKAIKVRIFVECLNLPQDRAEQIGG